MLMKKKEKYAGFGQKGLNKRFKLAALSGNLNQIRYFLLVENLDIHYHNNFVFRMACKKGYLDIVKFVLTSEELIEHAYIHADNELGLKKACEGGHIEVVKYLTTSEDLKDVADIYAIDKKIMTVVKNNGHTEVEKFLLYFKLNTQLPLKIGDSNMWTPRIKI